MGGRKLFINNSVQNKLFDSGDPVDISIVSKIVNENRINL